MFSKKKDVRHANAENWNEPEKRECSVNPRSLDNHAVTFSFLDKLCQELGIPRNSERREDEFVDASEVQHGAFAKGTALRYVAIRICQTGESLTYLLRHR